MYVLCRHAQLLSPAAAHRATRHNAVQQPAINLTNPRRVAHLLWDLDNVTIRPHADLLATLLSLQALARAAGAQQLTARMYANPATAKREAALLPQLEGLGVQVQHVPPRAQSADLALRGDAFAALQSHPPEDTALLLVSGDTDHAGVLSWATSRGVWTCVAAPWPPPRYAPHLAPRLEGDTLAAACCAALWLRAPRPAAAAAAAAAARPATTASSDGNSPTTPASPAVSQQLDGKLQGGQVVAGAPQLLQQQAGDAAASTGWLSDTAWSAWLDQQQQQSVEREGHDAVTGLVGASWAAGFWCNPHHPRVR